VARRLGRSGANYGGCKVLLILGQVLQLSGPHGESLIGSRIASLGARGCQVSVFFSFLLFLSGLEASCASL
jgi:hypothetical protein